MPKEREKIIQYLKGVKFRPRLFGVSEVDVWKKIGELYKLYTEALEAERVRYDTLLTDFKAGVAEEMTRLRDAYGTDKGES